MAAATNGFQEIIAESIEEFVDIIERYEHEFYDEYVPLLTLSKDPVERRLFYRDLDWASLRTLSPYLYMKYSDDALSLAEAEQTKRFETMKQAEHETYITSAALGHEFEPFGISPSQEESRGLTVNLPGLG